MNAIRFTRIDEGDGASECLTICQLDKEAFSDGKIYVECLGRETPFVVQIATGPSPGDDFVGLYDLDGERIDGNKLSWEIAEDVPADVIEAVEQWHGEPTRL